MNKEAIERTKARCKKSYRAVRPTNVPKLELERRLNENRQLYSQIINPKNMPFVYCDPCKPVRLSKQAKFAIISLVVSIISLLVAVNARADIYIKIGTGYKLLETDHIVRTTGEKVYFNTGGKISARIEIGKESGNWSYGVSHHSQWFSGFPVSEDGNEYQKTELFIDYKWAL